MNIELQEILASWFVILFEIFLRRNGLQFDLPFHWKKGWLKQKTSWLKLKQNWHCPSSFLFSIISFDPSVQILSPFKKQKMCALYVEKLNMDINWRHELLVYITYIKISLLWTCTECSSGLWANSAWSMQVALWSPSNGRLKMLRRIQLMIDSCAAQTSNLLVLKSFTLSILTYFKTVLHQQGELECKRIDGWGASRVWYGNKRCL